MKNNKNRFEKILAAGLAVGSLYGGEAGAANVKRPINAVSKIVNNDNKNIVDKILSNPYAKLLIASGALIAGGKASYDIGRGIVKLFKNNKVDFQKVKISDLKSDNIVIGSGKILFAVDVIGGKDNVNFEDFQESNALLKSAEFSKLYDGTKEQFISGVSEYRKFFVDHDGKIKVSELTWESLDNALTGNKTRKIYYLIDAEDTKNGDAANADNKIGLTTDTVFEWNGIKFKVKNPEIAKLEQTVLVKNMVSGCVCNNDELSLKGDDIEIISRGNVSYKDMEGDDQRGALEHVANGLFGKGETPSFALKFFKIPNEVVKIGRHNINDVKEDEEKQEKKQEDFE